jgi:hypothetical protein
MITTLARTTRATNRIVQLADFRRDMKALGYKVRIRSNSTFSNALILDENDVAINAGNVLTPEHIAAHQAFYDYKNATSVRDGDWVIVF